MIKEFIRICDKKFKLNIKIYTRRHSFNYLWMWSLESKTFNLWRHFQHFELTWPSQDGIGDRWVTGWMNTRHVRRKNEPSGFWTNKDEKCIIAVKNKTNKQPLFWADTSFESAGYALCIRLGLQNCSVWPLWLMAGVAIPMHLDSFVIGYILTK